MKAESALTGLKQRAGKVAERTLSTPLIQYPGNERPGAKGVTSIALERKRRRAATACRLVLGTGHDI